MAGVGPRPASEAAWPLSPQPNPPSGKNCQVQEEAGRVEFLDGPAKWMYPEQSMKALAISKEAFKADGWVAASALITFLAGFTALISAEWATAGLFLSLSALNFVTLREKLGPKWEQAAKWTLGVVLAAGIALLGVACLYATSGDIALAIVTGLAGAAILVNPYFGRRRQSDAGRPKISS